MIKPGTIRFILALIVVTGHTAPGWVFLGHFAVICFFILSGYWISNLYDRQYANLQRPIFVFYISRLWRLLPMLLLFTILAGIVCYFFEHNIFIQTAQYSSRQKVMYWSSHLLTLGLALQSPRLLAPAWSLDVELQFYILFPFMYFFITRYKKHALALLLIYAVIVTGYYSWRLQTHDSLLTHTICYYFLFFLAGMIIYYRSLVFGRRVEWACNLVFLSAVVLMYIEIIPQSSRMANELLPFLLIPLISNSVKIKSGKTDTFLGNISYVVYLAHWVCFVPLNHFFHFTDRQLPAVNRLLFLIIYLALTGIVSLPAYLFVDKKLNLVRKKWVAKQPAIQHRGH